MENTTLLTADVELLVPVANKVQVEAILAECGWPIKASNSHIIMGGVALSRFFFHHIPATPLAFMEELVDVRIPSDARWIFRYGPFVFPQLIEQLRFDEQGVPVISLVKQYCDANAVSWYDVATV
jgi:hypothetical protein